MLLCELFAEVNEAVTFDDLEHSTTGVTLEDGIDIIQTALNIAYDKLRTAPSMEQKAEVKRLFALRDAHWAAILAKEPVPAPAPTGSRTDGYRGEHEAPDHTSGSPMWNLAGCFPDDFYGPEGFRYYGDEGDYLSYNTAASTRNRPNMPVKVYRAIPADPAIPRRINPGDWVTLNRRYAVEHGRDNLRNEYRIVSKTVYARDLFTDGNSLQEWGYDPQPRVARPPRRTA